MIATGNTISLFIVDVYKRQHFIIYSCRVADAENWYATVYQFFTYPVYSSVALSADKYLRFPVQRFINRFDERGCFSCSRRAVDNGDITRA